MQAQQIQVWKEKHLGSHEVISAAVLKVRLVIIMKPGSQQQCQKSLTIRNTVQKGHSGSSWVTTQPTELTCENPNLSWNSEHFKLKIEHTVHFIHGVLPT